MRSIRTLWLGVLAFALLPALAQQPNPAQSPAGAATATANVKGHVTNPTGAPQQGGTVSFIDPSKPTASAGDFPVSKSGDYTGTVPAGTYSVVYRAEGMDKTKEADRYDNVKVVAGQDLTQDVDMSRQAYIDKLPEDQKKQLEDLRKHNSDALKANEVIKNINADLKTVGQDLKDAEQARAAAVQQLGATAAKADVDAKANEIRTAKYTEVESIMTKDAALRPAEPVLWAYLGEGQVGLKKYDDALGNFKKALDAQTALKKPNPQVEGMANSGIGEVYARTGKVSDANTAYAAAAKANPPSAGTYLRNQTVIFFQQGNADAQVAAADVAIKNDPNDALLYYLKGQGMIQKATFDPKTQHIVLPEGCSDAYQKYLELAPTGPYAAEVQGILQQAGQKVNSSYKSGRK